MLNTETNTPEMEKSIRAAFVTYAANHGIDVGTDADAFNTAYEHGQWWVFASGSDADEFEHDRTFSVVDAEGGPAIYVPSPDGDAEIGFDFEEV